MLNSSSLFFFLEYCAQHKLNLGGGLFLLLFFGASTKSPWAKSREVFFFFPAPTFLYGIYWSFLKECVFKRFWCGSVCLPVYVWLPIQIIRCIQHTSKQFASPPFEIKFHRIDRRRQKTDAAWYTTYQYIYIYRHAPSLPYFVSWRSADANWRLNCAYEYIYMFF